VGRALLVGVEDGEEVLMLDECSWRGNRMNVDLSGSMLQRKMSQQETWDHFDKELSSIPNRKVNQ
jgi:hypothetical protein